MDFLLLSCLGFAITAHAQDCARPAGGPNMHLMDKHILKDTFPDGDQAAFECDVGYMSAGGSSSITCTAGSWSAVMLKCERKNCGSPGEVEHGYIDYPKETLFGDHIEITCNEGYRLVGRSNITCGAEGWLDRLPTCEVINCEEPHVEHGSLTHDARPPYRHNDKVTFQCSWFYYMDGNSTLTCQADGLWSSPPPTCAYSHGKVALVVLGGVAFLIAGTGAAYGGHRWSQQGREKRLVEAIAPEAEEEVALLDGVGLKQSPAGNGQTSGEGHRGQVARKRVNHVGQK